MAQKLWFHDLPLDWSRPDTRAAEAALLTGYDTNADALRLAKDAGLRVVSLDQGAKVKHLVRQILESARKAGLLERLLAEVLCDEERAELHPLLLGTLRGGVADVAAARFRLRPTSTLGHLPCVDLWAGAEAEPRSFEKLTSLAADFDDVTTFRDRLAEACVRAARVEAGGGLGTGFLVGPSLLLTAYHVVEGVRAGETPKVRFDHRRRPDGTEVSPGRVVAFANDWRVAFSPHATPSEEASPDGPTPGPLDYCLVRLAEAVGSEPVGEAGAEEKLVRGHYALSDAAEPHAFDPEGPIRVVGHPEGRPMQLSIASPAHAQLTRHGVRVRYATNTLGGSSGSPVFDKSWRVVALHHGVGSSVAGPLGKPSGRNQGIPMHLVVEDLRRRLTGRAELGELGL